MNFKTHGLDPGQETYAGAHYRARQALILRRRRAKHFNPLMFNEPGWDILLHLFVCEQDGGRCGPTELAQLAGTSQSTMLRWLAVLIDERLVESIPAESAGEPNILLTGLGRLSMLELFST